MNSRPALGHSLLCTGAPQLASAEAERAPDPNGGPAADSGSGPKGIAAPRNTSPPSLRPFRSGPGGVARRVALPRFPCVRRRALPIGTGVRLMARSHGPKGMNRQPPPNPPSGQKRRYPGIRRTWLHHLCEAEHNVPQAQPATPNAQACRARACRRRWYATISPGTPWASRASSAANEPRPTLQRRGAGWWAPDKKRATTIAGTQSTLSPRGHTLQSAVNCGRFFGAVGPHGVRETVLGQCHPQTQERVSTLERSHSHVGALGQGRGMVVPDRLD